METRGQGDWDGKRVSLSPRLLVSLSFLLRGLCVLCGYFSVVAAVGAGPQEVVRVEGAAFLGELVSVGADGVVTFRSASREGMVAEATAPSEELKLRELVRWGNLVAPRGQTIVVLADGGQLVTTADWSGGAAVRLEGDAVVVLSDLFGEIRLAKEMVRGVVFAQRRHVAERESLVERIRREPSLATASPKRPGPSPKGRGNDDAVILSNGDRLSGSLMELARGSLAIKTSAGAVKVPLSRVDAVVLKSRQSSVVSRQLRCVVGLRDGSLVYADSVVADEKELKLEVGKLFTLAGGDVGDVVFLQPLGRRVVYVSDLEPADYRHVPYLSVDWPYHRDRNVLGEPLVVGGKRYLKGIGMHSAGRLSYRLDGKYSRFEAAVAIDDEAGKRGSVTFGVYVLRDGKMSEAYKSGIVRGGEAPQAVSVDVSGAQGITLTVDFADRGDEMDRADWLDARVLKDVAR